MQNRNIYTVKEVKSKDTKVRGLKGTNEDISISQETESKDTKKPQSTSQKIQGRRVKRYGETPVSKSKGTLQDSVKRYKETSVKLHTSKKKNPSQKCALA